MNPASITIALFFLAASAANGLKCNEGFNMMVNGVPFYHWKERYCTANSKCFGQEMMVKLPLADLKFDVTMRYGACLSTAYADYLDCNNLFSKASTFDPAKLLDLVPDIVDRFNATIQDFVIDIALELKNLFSNGKGTREFIDGIFTFFTNMGFDMKKAEPLKPSLTKLYSSIFGIDYQKQLDALQEFASALENLDTANAKFTDNLKKFISAVSSPYYSINRDPLMSAFVEKGPGLLRDILPSNWKLSLWYDVIFELMGDVDPTNWTKTAEDMVKTIKSSYDIPADVLEILNPVFDRIPSLANGSMTNPIYIGTWSLDLLKAYSERDEATAKMAKSLLNFVQEFMYTPLQREYVTMIQWTPGLMYRIFPKDKSEIQQVYTKIGDGLSSFNFRNLTDTAEPTKLSNFLVNFIPKVRSRINFQDPSMDDFINATIINFSKMMYQLLSDYTFYLDTIADVMAEGLKNYPDFDAGQIIENLIVKFGGSVPEEMKPLLKHMQVVISAAIDSSSYPDNIDEAFTIVINAYKEAYPFSPFPDLVQRFINNMIKFAEYSANPYYSSINIFELNMNMTYWQIDLQFAIFEISNISGNEFSQMLIKAFPSLETYLKLLAMLKSEDINELIKNIMKWATNYYQVKTPENFIAAIKPTAEKISYSISSLLGDLRKLAAPDLCKFGSCDGDLCNNHGYIEGRPAVTKLGNESGGEVVSLNTVLIISALWIALKAII